MGRINRYIWFLLMIIIGGGVGLYYAWYVKPADFVDAALYNMRQDYKTDYVLMAAEIYDNDHDRYHAMLRLDRILDQGETAEESVRVAITNAKNSDYQLVDVEKMERLYEVVTGQRSTPTPHIDLTMIYDIEQQSTQSAITLAGGTPQPADTTGSGNVQNEPSGGSVSTGPQADSDPFGTGIRITTDPNALPMLDLPLAPTITPNPNASVPSHTGTQVSINTDGFSGIPDSFFGGN